MAEAKHLQRNWLQTERVLRWSQVQGWKLLIADFHLAGGAGGVPDCLCGDTGNKKTLIQECFPNFQHAYIKCLLRSDLFKYY